MARDPGLLEPGHGLVSCAVWLQQCLLVLVKATSPATPGDAGRTHNQPCLSSQGVVSWQKLVSQLATCPFVSGCLCKQLKRPQQTFKTAREYWYCNHGDGIS